MPQESTFREDTGVLICEKLAEGRSLLSISRDVNVSESTIRNWVRDGIEPFATNYARAREIADDLKFDRLEDLASEEPPLVEGRVDSGWVQWKKNQLDQFKWNLMRNRPKKYGDKLDLNQSGTIEVIKRVVSDL